MTLQVSGYRTGVENQQGVSEVKMLQMSTLSTLFIRSRAQVRNDDFQSVDGFDGFDGFETQGFVVLRLQGFDVQGF